MILLDTNILIYALGKPHPLQEPCRRIVSAIMDGRVEATTSPICIQEFMHFWSKSRSREEAARKALEFIDLLEPLPGVETTVTRMGCEVFESEALDAADSMIAASALSPDVTYLVSADEDFAFLDRWRDPRHPDILALL